MGIPLPFSSTFGQNFGCLAARATIDRSSERHLLSITLARALAPFSQDFFFFFLLAGCFCQGGGSGLLSILPEGTSSFCREIEFSLVFVWKEEGGTPDGRNEAPPLFASEARGRGWGGVSKERRESNPRGFPVGYYHPSSNARCRDPSDGLRPFFSPPSTPRPLSPKFSQDPSLLLRITFERGRIFLPFPLLPSARIA